ncbi:CGI-121-domain-containing protein [Viridothelium virens]|uniref:EKC/KEOPS complex subunit CGI121 n=1 Tax=Viridothelium virens TaxID=1048519 RepID=A0A6A6HEV1_VIRVR|nr:CGI-121-domain-containing protein [Viridothelium virens]
MAAVQALALGHLPGNPLFVGTFRDVKNVSFLRSQLLTGNPDYEYAFIDAEVILSTTHLLAACFRAINNLNANRLKTRNVHSEIVFALSPNNNIAESFRRFGLVDDTKHIVAIKVGMSTTPDITEESVRRHLMANVEGNAAALADATFAETGNVARIRKLYKIQDQSSAQPKSQKQPKLANGVTGPESKAGEDFNKVNDLESIILGLMALKGS